ncbi:hypothetical protein M8J75_009077 [Diaphorina citri]|nr:hypothetical protein M8J75_009077 [Diaphorina citri]
MCSKSSKKIAFDDNVSVSVYKNDEGEYKSGSAHTTVEIDEDKIDRLLNLLHEADPEDASHDTEEMLDLEGLVNGMGPLIDTELETVDKEHAQLTQLSSQLVDALNLYHTLMKEPFPSPVPAGQTKAPYPGPNYQQGANMPPNVNMYNGMGPPHPQQYGAPSHYMPGVSTQYNMPAQNLAYPPQQVPNSTMGPMYGGMQPPTQHYPAQHPPQPGHPPQPQGQLPLQHPPPHTMPPHQILPQSPLQSQPGNRPQAPPIRHLPPQPHSLPTQMGQMHSQGPHIPNQMPLQGQHMPQGQGMGAQLPPQPGPQPMGGMMGHTMPPAQYPGAMRHPMPPSHLPQL